MPECVERDELLQALIKLITVQLTPPQRAVLIEVAINGVRRKRSQALEKTPGRSTRRCTTLVHGSILSSGALSANGAAAISAVTVAATLRWAR
ncbi:MAG: hypothetical protein ACRDPA_32695 [Solirubrobacteraceae bacterium]